MDLSASLAADLDLLSAAIQDADGNLETRLLSFVEGLRNAVGSYLGLTLTIGLDGHEITFTLTEHAAQAGTSLRIPLAAVAGDQAGSALVLYAATPGALVDLAADMTWALKLDPSALTLDEDLAVPVASDAVIGLREHGIINRAIGALIDRGHSAESARSELRRHAERDHGDIPAAAQRILDSIRGHPLPEPG